MLSALGASSENRVSLCARGAVWRMLTLTLTLALALAIGLVCLGASHLRSSRSMERNTRAQRQLGRTCTATEGALPVVVLPQRFGRPLLRHLAQTSWAAWWCRGLSEVLLPWACPTSPGGKGPASGLRVWVHRRGMPSCVGVCASPTRARVFSYSFNPFGGPAGDPSHGQ